MFKRAVGTLLATFASADINADYHDLIHGIVEKRETDLHAMWDQFKTEFKHLSPINLQSDNAVIQFFEKVN